MTEIGEHDLDAVVAGGGPVGLVSAIGLAELGAKVCVIEPRRKSDFLTGPTSSRVYAIIPPAKVYLDRIGVWKHLVADRQAFFDAIAVVDECSGGKLNFPLLEGCTDHMAWIVEHDNLLYASLRRLAELKIGQVRGKAVDVVSSERAGAIFWTEEGRKVGGRLGVIADGAESLLRGKLDIGIKQHSYNARACVANVETELNHNHVARQYFLPSGPLAFLPLPEPNQWSIVWSCDDKKAKEIEDLSCSQISQRLVSASNGELGKVSIRTERSWFPLQLLFAESWVKGKCVLVGDSAHVIHPLAGQGLNTGLLDAAALVDSLKFNGHLKNWPRTKDLFSYGRWRKYEARKMGIATHFVNTLFHLNDGQFEKIRGIGVNALNRAPILKDWLVAQAMGGIN